MTQVARTGLPLLVSSRDERTTQRAASVGWSPGIPASGAGSVAWQVLKASKGSGGKVRNYMWEIGTEYSTVEHGRESEQFFSSINLQLILFVS